MQKETIEMVKGASLEKFVRFNCENKICGAVSYHEKRFITDNDRLMVCPVCSIYYQIREDLPPEYIPRYDIESLSKSVQKIKQLKLQLRMFCDFIEGGQVTAANVLAAKIRNELDE